jgi:Phage tail assembly chaperone proteins, E, or 41 or 14
MALPEDPELKPVAAAQAEMDRLEQEQASSERASPALPTSARPLIEPAEPDRWSRVLPLTFALVVDGQRIDALTLRRLSSQELIAIIMQDDREESINRRARAAIAGVHPDVLDALDADDALEVADAIRPFLPRALLGAETLEMDILVAAAARADDAG